MLPNQYVEQVNRLAEYIILAQRGLTNAEAFQKIAKTHFDYAVKSNFEQMMEVVFPFYTYISRNLTYWVNAVQEHPWIVSLYEDIMTPVWNFDDISYEELSRNRSLQYQVLAGNIPLNDKGMTLKLRPSFMDVYGLFTQPIEFVTNKLAAPFRAVLDIGLQNNVNKLSKWAQATMNISSQYQPQPSTGFLEQYSEFIPILGTLFQRYGEMGPIYFNRTGNILNKVLPGIFGATQRWEDYQFKQGSHLKQAPRQYQSSFSRNTPSFHRAYAKKTYAKKIYAKKTYAKKTYAKQYYPNYYNKIPRYESFYKKHYTKQGKSRLKQMMLPVTGYSLHYKLKNLFRYMR